MPEAVNNGDNMPITLAQAQKMIGGLYSIAFLRKERDAGRLHVFRVGNKDLTTPNAVMDMVEKWQDQENQHGSSNEKTGQSAKTDQPQSPAPTKSKTATSASGRELLSARINQLQGQTKRFGSTSKADTSQTAQVIPMQQKSGKS